MQENMYKCPEDSTMRICVSVITYRGMTQDLPSQNLHLHLPVETVHAALAGRVNVCDRQSARAVGKCMCREKRFLLFPSRFS